MKLAKQHINTFLTTIAVFLVFGNVAFASEVLSSIDKAVVVSHLQQDDNSKPFEINKVSIGEASQTITQNETSNSGLTGLFYSNKEFPNTCYSSVIKCSFSLKDKRKLIFQYLFPFHFFW
ncbi:hypothetical protein [Aequorivita sediminis]|uniref:hypothetical protein n=1 Tax=Aequorivita sediminis TaxID=3073653 RepID=UPI0028A72B25|nr:hypothetical protein [Aequorivita sp. F6058]